jgi:hypothetical protein
MHDKVEDFVLVHLRLAQDVFDIFDMSATAEINKANADPDDCNVYELRARTYVGY